MYPGYHIVIAGILAVFLPIVLHADDIQVTLDVVQAECNDGVDNDSDGLIDYPADPGCDDAFDLSEDDPVFVCSDGIDNDNDGLIDYPADPGCSNAYDTSEVNIPSGGGSGSSSGTNSGTSFANQNTHSGASSFTFSIDGQTAPNHTVLLLRDGVVAAVTTSDSSGEFSFNQTPARDSLYNVSVVTVPSGNAQTTPYTFPVSVSQNNSVVVNGLVLPPDVSVRSDAGAFVISGESFPNSIIELVDQNRQPVGQVTTNSLGEFTFTVAGDSYTEFYLRTTTPEGRRSEWTKGVFVTRSNGGQIVIGDVNNDTLVTIEDFSRLLYWYKNPPAPEAFLDREQLHLTSDRRIDLYDFSLMAYHWTGSI